MWFTENPWPPMLISGLLAFVFLALWNANRRDLHFAIAMLFVLLAVGIYFAERAIVTEGERLQLRVTQLCEDFRTKKLEKVLDYVSDTNPDLKGVFETAFKLVTIQSDLRLSDFQTTFTNENSRARVHFRANATIGVTGMGDVGYHPARLILTFQREKGEWKIIEVERLNPITGVSMGVLDQSSG